MTDPERWKLVGLETLDGSVLPDGAYAMAEGENANGQRNTQGPRDLDLLLADAGQGDRHGPRAERPRPDGRGDRIRPPAKS
jgi:hypothetical protein